MKYIDKLNNKSDLFFFLYYFSFILLILQSVISNHFLSQNPNFIAILLSLQITQICFNIFNCYSERTHNLIS